MSRPNKRFDGWYPGTKQPPKLYGKEPPLKLEPGQLDLGEPAETSPVELWEIGVLAKLLNRGSASLRGWERKGIIPSAQYQSDRPRGAGYARLYTRAQIETIVRIADEEGILDARLRKPIPAAFTERLTEVWKA